jgi:hypothetical protein
MPPPTRTATRSLGAGGASHWSYYRTRLGGIHTPWTGSDRPGRSAPFSAERTRQPASRIRPLSLETDARVMAPSQDVPLPRPQLKLTGRRGRHSAIGSPRSLSKRRPHHPSLLARVGPTTPTRAGRLADASVDPTEARCAGLTESVWVRMRARRSRRTARSLSLGGAAGRDGIQGPRSASPCLTASTSPRRAVLAASPKARCESLPDTASAERHRLRESKLEQLRPILPDDPPEDLG